VTRPDGTGRVVDARPVPWRPAGREPDHHGHRRDADAAGADSRPRRL